MHIASEETILTYTYELIPNVNAMKHQTYSYPDFLSEKVFRVFYFARTQLQMVEKLNAKKKKNERPFIFPFRLFIVVAQKQNVKLFAMTAKIPIFDMSLNSCPLIQCMYIVCV